MSSSGDGWGLPVPAEAAPAEDVAPAAPAEDGVAPAEDGAVATNTSGFEPMTGWIQPKKYDYTELTTGEHIWEGNAAVYEWDGEEGDIGPELEELEVILFGEPDKRGKHGIDFTQIDSIEVVQESTNKIQPIADFKDAGLHPAMLRNIELAGYEVPTPIQRYGIPAINTGHDLIAVAQTGSGKTAAYLIPILSKLMGKAKKLAAPRPNPDEFRVGLDSAVRAEPLVTILCPSRELAVQIFNEARKFCYRTMLRPCVIYGGGPLRDQVEQLAKGCDVLIATPGRLVDLMDRPHVLSLNRLKYMVIDEADEMLQSDWQEEFTKILSGGDQDEGNVKYMLFSATFPKPARDLAKDHLAEDHIRIRVGRAGSSHANIRQVVHSCQESDKKRLLYDSMITMPPVRTIIFVNNKRTADELDDFLFNLGVPCTSMHSDRTQREREAAMRGFRGGDSPVLVTTGVTARGIDVRNVMHVINYDLPSVDFGGIEEYTHRIGRTGRIGHRGLATSFFTERDEPIASVLTRTLLETGQEIPEFLQQYVPDGEAREKLKFEADSDFEDDAGFGGFGGGTDQDQDDDAHSAQAAEETNEDAGHGW